MAASSEFLHQSLLSAHVLEAKAAAQAAAAEALPALADGADAKEQQWSLSLVYGELPPACSYRRLTRALDFHRASSSSSSKPLPIVLVDLGSGEGVPLATSLFLQAQQGEILAGFGIEIVEKLHLTALSLLQALYLRLLTAASTSSAEEEMVGASSLLQMMRGGHPLHFCCDDFLSSRLGERSAALSAAGSAAEASHMPFSRSTLEWKQELRWWDGLSMVEAVRASQDARARAAKKGTGVEGEEGSAAETISGLLDASRPGMLAPYLSAATAAAPGGGSAAAPTASAPASSPTSSSSSLGPSPCPFSRIILCNSTCFDEATLQSLFLRLEKLQAGDIVILTSHKMGSPLFELLEEVEEQASWGSVTVRTYRRKQAPKWLGAFARGLKK